MADAITNRIAKYGRPWAGYPAARELTRAEMWEEVERLREEVRSVEIAVAEIIRVDREGEEWKEGPNHEPDTE